MEKQNKTSGKTETEAVGVTETAQINPLEISEQEIDFCNKQVREIYFENHELYSKASDVVEQLGLGGLWRGHSACVLIVANAIKQGVK